MKMIEHLIKRSNLIKLVVNIYEYFLRTHFSFPKLKVISSSFLFVYAHVCLYFCRQRSLSTVFKAGSLFIQFSTFSFPPFLFFLPASSFLIFFSSSSHYHYPHYHSMLHYIHPCFVPIG